MGWVRDTGFGMPGGLNYVLPSSTFSPDRGDRTVGGGITRAGGGTAAVSGGGNILPSSGRSVAAPSVQAQTSNAASSYQPVVPTMEAQNPLVSLLMNKYANQDLSGNPYSSKLQQMMTGEFSPDDPSYKWRFQQGQQALERSLAARGLLQSGNAAIELQQYGQGAASQEYGAQFQRMMGAMGQWDQSLSAATNRLATLAGVDLNNRQSMFNAALSGANIANRASEFGLEMGMKQSMFNAQQLQSASGASAELGLKAQGMSLDAALRAQSLDIQRETSQAQAQASLSQSAASMQNVWDNQQKMASMNAGADWRSWVNQNEKSSLSISGGGEGWQSGSTWNSGGAGYIGSITSGDTYRGAQGAFATSNDWSEL